LPLNNDVDALFAKKVISVEDWITFLSLKRDALGLHFETYGPCIDALSQSRAKCAMHGDAASNRSMNQFFEFVGEARSNPEHMKPFRVFAVSWFRGFVSSWPALFE
jgi:hypothetical protein